MVSYSLGGTSLGVLGYVKSRRGKDLYSYSWLVMSRCGLFRPIAVEQGKDLYIKLYIISYIIFRQGWLDVVCYVQARSVLTRSDGAWFIFIFVVRQVGSSFVLAGQDATRQFRVLYLRRFKMPLIQFYLPEEIDREIKHFMIDNKIIDKREAIRQVLRNYFKR